MVMQAPAVAVPAFEFSPWRLSGVVVGTLLNDPARLAALGGAVHRPPYKAPPRAPVLYVKPRNTLAGNGSCVAVPRAAGRLEIGGSLGIVVGRTACRVPEAEALGHVAGYTLVADLCVPHEAVYRPSVRLRALDGSCLIGPAVVPRDAVADPDALTLEVAIEGAGVHRARTAGMVRPMARLLADVSDFMTLHPGDLLMLGVAAGAPQAGAGMRFAVACAGLGRLEGRLVDEDAEGAP